MKRLTAIATALVVAFLVAVTMNVKAQDLNPQEKTYLTFSGPVELPGMTLPAGTYTFKLADTPGRNVVQVMSQDEKEIHGQFLFVQSTRRDATGETVVTFKETAAGTTPAVQYWYYPGETIGKEFVYPKDQATKIAARTGATVLSTEGEISANSTVTSIDKEGKVTPWERETRNSQTPAASAQAEAQPAPASDAPAPAQPTAAAGSPAGNRGVQTERESTTAGTSGQAGANANATADVRADTRAPQREGQVAASELPRTASPLPISGLIGLLSLASGFGLRVIRR
jgi:hypothetical protein